jgi:rhamnosyltransferase
MPPPAETPALPRIAVLMATYNGRRWLDEQLDSILSQEGVELRVIALDDESTDGTRERLLERAAGDARLVVLDSIGASGSSAANFSRLIVHAPFEPDEFVSFADQDDVWMPGKLARHAAIIAQRAADGVSSNVTAFTPAGKRTLVRKAFPQREFDYLTESPGPGSTFLITPRLAALARETIAAHPELTARVDYHDSLVYAIARARGWGWHIDDVSSVDYRQHDDNVMGANSGAQAARERLALIREHWHRGQAASMAEVGLTVADERLRPGIERMRALFADTGIRSRLALARRASQMRRRPRDRFIIGTLITLGIW